MSSKLTGLLLLHLEFSLDGGVEVILDVIVCSSRKVLGDLSPLVAELLVSSDDDLIFLLSPLASLDVGIEMVVPSLSALLADSAGELARDDAPVLGSVFLNQNDDLGVFFLSPRSFDQFGVQNLLPSMETLDVSSVRKV
jgi:hypothetical protein